MDNRLATFRRTLRLHFNWLIVKLLGKDLLSKEELSELKDYGRLSLGDEVSLIERSFALGRESALSKKSEYKDLDLDKLSKLQKRKYSSVEKLAIREAKLHTARRIQRLADEASADAYNRVNKATRDLLEDVTSKDILADEVALAVAEKKTRQQLATSVANKLGRDFSSEMKKLAVTEMHRAKQRGAAMAIANKVGIYQRSEGVDSMVSVVPNKGACKDCLNLYTDEGNPRVFPLKILMAQGSNADEGVSHARGPGGLHTGWKPVMPPAHPNCYCELTYVPAGMAWENGKLKIVDELRYKESISKAYDPSSMNATIKPKGGESYQKNEPPKVASIPGVAAPGNTPGPGSPKGSGATAPQAPTSQLATAKISQPQQPQGGAEEEYEPCIFNGDERCKRYGGSGTEKHLKGGKVVQEHLKAQGKLQQTLSPEQVAFKLQEIKNSKLESFSPSDIDDWIVNGVVINRKDIKEVKGGIRAGITSTSVKVEKLDLAEGISVLNKPPLPGKPQVAGAEVSAYTIGSIYGKKNEGGGAGRVCNTKFRVNEKGEKCSAQAWVQNSDDGYSFMKRQVFEGKYSVGKDGVTTYHLIKGLKQFSANWDQLRDQLEEAIVTDVIMMNCDRHVCNLMFDESLENCYAIDHGFIFGRGGNGYRNHYHEGMNKLGMKIRIPNEMRVKIAKTSFSQLQSGLEESATMWRAAQTYLRGKYAIQVEDEHGHLPYKALGGGDTHGQENLQAVMLTRYSDRNFHFNQEGNSVFERFAINWMDQHASDPESPEHETAKQFLEEGILMNTLTDPSSRKDGNAERQAGEHFAYEKFIRSHNYLQTYQAAKLGHAKAADDAMRDERDRIETEWFEYEDNYFKEKFAIQDRILANPGMPKAEREVLSKQMEANGLLYKVKQAQKDQKKATLKMRVVSGFVPPGQEERFKQLDSKISQYQSGKAPLPLKMNTGKVPTPAKPNKSALEAGARRMVEDGKQLREAKAKKEKKINWDAVQAMADQQQAGSGDVDIPLGVGGRKGANPVQVKGHDVVQQIKAAMQVSPAAAPSAASVIEGSKTIRAQEVALSHADKMVRDAKRQLKLMKRDVPAARKKLQKQKIEKLREAHEKLEGKVEKMKQRAAVRYKDA